jgi:SpoVK/Ycf46/Vps4 family AAA+-type ATPase
MSEGRIIRDLLKTHVCRDEEGFRRAAKDLIERERSLNHRVLADDLERILVNGTNGNGIKSGGKPGIPWEIPKDKDKGYPLLNVSRPEIPWERLVLPPVAMRQLEAVADENHRRDLLLGGGLKPKQKVLFVGPPGCGKTLAASVLATALAWPLATVRLDTVVSSFLGETATNLRRIFDFIGQDRFVVLFDEFDALGKERDRGQEHGELQRVVTALLQLMDGCQGESLLVFATNHQFMLDTALWRRFDSIVPFNIPTEQDRLLMLRLFFRAFGHTDEQLAALARATDGASGSDIEWLVTEMMRKLLLDGRRQLEKRDMDEALANYRLRMETVSNMNPKLKRPPKRKRKGDESNSNAS